MNNLKFDKETGNLGGLSKLVFFAENEVEIFGDIILGQISEISLIDDTEASSANIIPESSSFSEIQKAADLFGYEFVCKIAKDEISKYSNLLICDNSKIIAIVTDNNNQERLIGEPGNACVVETKLEKGQAVADLNSYTLTFKWQSRYRAAFAENIDLLSSTAFDFDRETSNFGGIQELNFFAENEVDNFGDIISGQIYQVLFVDPATVPASANIIPESSSFVEIQKAADLFDYEFVCKIAKDSIDKRTALLLFDNNKLIAKVTDNNNHVRLIGEPGNACVVETKLEKGQAVADLNSYTLTFTWQSRHRAPFADNLIYDTLSNWILSSGYWDDEKIWIDEELWIDGE